MKRVCAWCGMVIDPGDGEDERITHGMCVDCYKRVKAEILAGGYPDQPVREVEVRG